MNTANTVKNKIDKPISQNIANSTQVQYLNRKVAELKGKGIQFKIIANRDTVQSSSIVQRAIKKFNLMFNYCPSNDSNICGILYYSKKNNINLNCIINYDGTVSSQFDALWRNFKDLFLKSEASFRCCCRHFALAWVTNELDIKNIDNLSDLKKSDFFTKFSGKETGLEKILTFYDLYYKTENINKEIHKLKFSSNNFSKLLNSICCEMEQQKEQSRLYLIKTTAHKNKKHMLALKISIKNNAVKINFYDPNDTLREQKIIFNSIDNVRHLTFKKLLDLNHRKSYGIDNLTDKKNCTLQRIPVGYSITQNIFVKGIIDHVNNIENRCAIMETAINEIQNNFKKYQEHLKK
jgi:hypothetical protein